MLLALVVLSAGCGAAPALETRPTPRPGQATRIEDRYGTVYVYLPATAPAQPEILVLVHGTPARTETAEADAQYYLQHWLDFAAEQGFFLLAPAFNQADFSSRRGDHAMSGYRGLFGREIGADEWVLDLVDGYQQAWGTGGRPFYLYGHSAGGQFAARFLVTHPERVKQAVITAAATYPQPTPAVAWPFGMGELHTGIEWDEQTVTRVDIVPDQEKWLAATQVPLTVIVGLNDTAELPPYPGQKGRNRFGIARNWVRDMELLAAENGLECRFKFEMVPGQGHSMSGLLPYSQAAFEGGR